MCSSADYTAAYIQAGGKKPEVANTFSVEAEQITDQKKPRYAKVSLSVGHFLLSCLLRDHFFFWFYVSSFGGIRTFI